MSQKKNDWVVPRTMKTLWHVDIIGQRLRLWHFGTRFSIRGFPGGTVVKNRLPMQGTRVRALVREDPTCRGATKPVHRNYWACALEPVSCNYWSPRATTTEARAPRARAPQREAPAMRSPRAATKSSPRSPQLEKARAQRRRPHAAEDK